MCECMDCRSRFDFSQLVDNCHCPNCGSTNIVDWDDPLDNPDLDPEFDDKSMLGK